MLIAPSLMVKEASMEVKLKHELLESYRPEIGDLPGDLSLVAEIAESISPTKGVEIALAICKAFQSTNIYCHNVDNIFRKQRNKAIINQYDLGKRVVDLARENHLSERQVWNILGKVPD